MKNSELIIGRKVEEWRTNISDAALIGNTTVMKSKDFVEEPPSKCALSRVNAAIAWSSYTETSTT
jgi:hypothetical protein